MNKRGKMEMKKFLQKKLNNEKGMTLIELLAVIVIIAIIAAIAIPAIGNIIENSRVGTSKADAINILNSAELYLTENPAATTITQAELVPNFLDDAGSFTAGFSVVETAGVLEVSGVSTVGGVEVTYSSASKQEINAVPNSSATGGAGVAISR
jgi:type IV pilus assembly protein PilA